MNDKILKARWRAVDRLLSVYMNKIKLTNELTRDKLQDVFDAYNLSYDDIMEYANKEQVKKMRRKILDFLKNPDITDYSRFVVSKFKDRVKIKVKDIIYLLILMIYEEKNAQLRKKEKDLFDEIIKISYEQGQKEAIEIQKNGSVIPISTLIIANILSIPAYKGYEWKDYCDGNVLYETKMTFSQYILNVQQGKISDVSKNEFDKLLTKQEKAYLSVKKENDVNKYNGSLDNYVSFLANESALEGMKRQGIEYVRFIAIIDEKTTRMCDTLDGQIFKIYGVNTYSRYSAIDGKIITYETEGLQVGANLPPIDNHYHHCRSTIYPERK